MNFNASERELLGQLADVLIPAHEEFPSASAAGVAEEGMDQVLRLQPALEAGIKRIMAAARGRPAEAFMSELQQTDAATYALFGEMVAGAYFLNAKVRGLLGYAGQTPLPMEADPDLEGLLEPVRQRGRIYRPTSLAPRRGEGRGEG